MEIIFFNRLILLLFLFISSVSLSSEVSAVEQEATSQSLEEVNAHFEALEDMYISLKRELEEQEEVTEVALEEEDDQIKSPMSYADWAAITLACVAVLVTVLGVLIAVLSFWGYKNITREVRNSAETVSNEIAKEQVEALINQIAKEELVKLIDTGELRQHLEAAVDMIYRNDGLPGTQGGGFNKFPEIDQDEGQG